MNHQPSISIQYFKFLQNLFNMDSKILLSEVNKICWKQFQDINLYYLEKNKSLFVKNTGDFQIVLKNIRKGVEKVEIETNNLIYSGKGEWHTIIIFFVKHNIYIRERRFFIPKFKGGSCIDYQGSEFHEVTPKGKQWCQLDEL
jgi:hypothetical protein